MWKANVKTWFAISIILVASAGTTAVADGPLVQWQKTFGEGYSDWGYSVQQTSDGGFIIAGGTYSFGAGSYDVYLIKTDPNGNLQWQKTFGEGYSDMGYSVQQTSDGGYIIAGYTCCIFEGADSNVYLIKTDSAGNLQWQKTFGESHEERGNSVQQTADGGFIIAGTTLSFGTGPCYVYLIKTDPNGNLQWQKTFGEGYSDMGYSVQQTSDGGFIIAGGTYSFGAGSYDVYLIKTDLNGNLQWQKTFGGSNYDMGCSVQQTSDGGYIIAGYTYFITNGGDVYLIKTDSTGNLLWQKTFGGSNHDMGCSVQQTSDGGYIIAGTTDSFGAGGDDIYLIKVAPEKEFMITFDDGPVPGNTEKIVDALKNIYVGCEPVKAGFFMVGERVRDNPNVVKAVADAKHFIGDHTQHHPDFNGLFKDWSVEKIMLEISQCYDEIKKALNPNEPNKVNLRKIFRPPYLSVNPNVVMAADNLDFQIIMGAGENEDKTTEDYFWSTKEVKEHKAPNLIQSWHRDYPCVLVFHDRTSAALNITEIVEYLVKKKGFTLVHFDPQRLPKKSDSVVHHATNVIHQSETDTHIVSLDSTVSSATFNVSWEGSDLDLVLYKPDGTKIDSNSALLDPNIKYAERDTYEYYTISDPNPGNWIMEVLGVNVPPEGEKYTVRVEADTNLILSAFTDKPEYGLTEQSNVKAQLTNDGNSVTGALVMAKVQRPDGSIDNLTLYDDGTHGDKDPNDGFYANAYNNTSLRGSYEITVSAIGQLPGEQYERAYSLTAMVGSIIYGNVDFGAYAVFADHWLAQNCTKPAWCETADLDQSGEVDIFDMGVLAEHWLEGAAP